VLRLPPLPPTVVDGGKIKRRTTHGPCDDELLRLALEEAAADKGNAEVDRLSLKLAHLYRRDVFASHSVPYASFIVELMNGRKMEVERQIPSRRYLLEDRSWLRIAMSLNVARAVLKRDENMEVPNA
jgi:hypothetical protein